MRDDEDEGEARDGRADKEAKGDQMQKMTKATVPMC